MNPEIEVPKIFCIAKKKGWNLNKIKAYNSYISILLSLFKKNSFFCPGLGILKHYDKNNLLKNVIKDINYIKIL